LGLGNSVLGTDQPTKVGGLEDLRVLDVVCGESHVLCFTEKGSIVG